MEQLTYNSKTDTLGQLVIRRNGVVEQNVTEALESDMRRAALKYMATRTIEATIDATCAVGYAVACGLQRMMQDLDSTYVAPEVSEPITIQPEQVITIAQPRNTLGQFS